MKPEKTAMLVRRLARYEASWRAGNKLALLGALSDCQSFGAPPPPWLVRALVDIVTALPSRRRQDVINHTRWDAVTELRDRRRELEPHGYAPTWEAAYANASAVLEGTMAAGGPEAIKASYQKVAKEMKTARRVRYLPTRFDPKK